ncbi:hypothetical protein WP50_17570 [Lactiplantibacillus plantarum]|nr:hypothetical protein WP50_17570 [Lactiplantibacillus plantarum]
MTSDDAWLNNAQTTMVHAALTPEEATDPITWKSSDPSLAAVDEYGNVTAADAATDNSGKADDHGTVTITGTFGGNRRMRGKPIRRLALIVEPILSMRRK